MNDFDLLLKCPYCHRSFAAKDTRGKEYTFVNYYTGYIQKTGPISHQICSHRDCGKKSFMLAHNTSYKSLFMYHEDMFEYIMASYSFRFT